MEHPEDTAAEATVEETGRSLQERTQEAIEQIRRLLEEESLEEALALCNQLHPADQAEVLKGLSAEAQRALLDTLPPEGVAQILEHLEPEEAVQVFGGTEASALADILDEARPDVAADILRQLPEGRSQETLQAMEEAQEVIPLLEYQDDTAGGLMAPDYPVVREDLNTATALDVLRLRGPQAEDVSSVFVVDSEDKLVGSLSVVRLALARPNAIIREIMNSQVISVVAETDQEESARLMERYNINQLPVIDEEGRLIGVILAEDVLDVVEEEATEDMYRMAGIAGERVFGSLTGSMGHRLPWLFVNLGTTFLAAGVIALFESTIAKVVALAVFLPVVAGQGGIGGTQVLTLVVRSMALGEITGRRGVRLLAREVALGLIHGLLLGVAVGLVVYFWKGNFILGLVLGLAMVGNMLVAGLTGAGIPLLLRRLGIDPAVASAVFVTTFTDVTGFLLYLGIAAILIKSLL